MEKEETYDVYCVFLMHKLAQDLLEAWNKLAITENRIYKMLNTAISQNNITILNDVAKIMVPVLTWCWYSRTHGVTTPEDYFTRWQYNQIVIILFQSWTITDTETRLFDSRRKFDHPFWELRSGAKLAERRDLRELCDLYEKTLLSLRLQRQARIRKYLVTKSFSDIKTHVRFENGRQTV